MLEVLRDVLKIYEREGIENIKPFNGGSGAGIGEVEVGSMYH